VVIAFVVYVVDGLSLIDSGLSVRRASAKLMRNQIPECRAEEGLSQAGLAKAVGVTRQTINTIERERYDPSLGLAFELASHFECSIEDLFDPNK
jgi:putative transcriptional regulator